MEDKTSRVEQDLKEANLEKDQLLLRNASLSQQSELNCKELQEEIKELKSSFAKQVIYKYFPSMKILSVTNSEVAYLCNLVSNVNHSEFIYTIQVLFWH